MNGIILENADVIKGMENSARGVFINAEITADGALKGNLLSLKDFSLLHKKIDSILSDMGMSIHSGVIPAVPVDYGNDKTACDYCDYARVCLKENDSEKRKVLSSSHTEALKMLRGEEEA